MKSLRNILAVMAILATASTCLGRIVLFLPFQANGTPVNDSWIGGAIQQSLLTQATPIADSVKTSNQPVNINDASAAIQSANKAFADTVVFGSYQINGNQLNVTGEVLDVPSSQVLAPLQAGGPMTDLFTVETQLGEEMIAAIAPATGDTVAPPDYESQSPAPYVSPAPYTPDEPYYVSPYWDYPYWYGGLYWPTPSIIIGPNSNHHRDFDHDRRGANPPPARSVPPHIMPMRPAPRPVPHTMPMRPAPSPQYRTFSPPQSHFSGRARMAAPMAARGRR